MGDKPTAVTNDTPFLNMRNVTNMKSDFNQSKSIVQSYMFNCERDIIFSSEQLKQTRQPTV